MEFEHSEGVMEAEIEGGIVILDLASGEYYGLNEVGKILWRGLGVGRDLRDIINEMSAVYDVPEDTLWDDCVFYIKELARLGLLVEK